MRSNEIKKESNDIKKLEEIIKRKKSEYEINIYIYIYIYIWFSTFWKIRCFGESIYNAKISIDEAEIEQNNLLENIGYFNNKSRPRTKK